MSTERFTVYRSPEGKGYLLNIQAEAMSHFNTRVVVPLLPLEDAPKPASRLNPQFEIDGKPYSMVTQYLGTVPVKLLKHPVFRADARRDEIVEAVDLLLQGF